MSPGFRPIRQSCCLYRDSLIGPDGISYPTINPTRVGPSEAYIPLKNTRPREQGFSGESG